MYGTEVSPTLISSVTDAVANEVKALQSRPLDALYPIVYLDCIHVKEREIPFTQNSGYPRIGGLRQPPLLGTLCAIHWSQP
jgi:putative transposase